MTTRSTSRGTILALLTLCGIPACSDGQGMLADNQLSDEQSDDEQLTDEQLEEIGQLELALTSDANCGAANADQPYTSFISPAVTSPSTYAAGRNGCEKAYFVRISSYRSPDASKRNIFTYAGAQPTTEAACRDTKLMVYVFERKADGSVAFISNVTRFGDPDIIFGSFDSCRLPTFSPEPLRRDLPVPLPLTLGSTYQFAVSARTNNSGNPVMQPIRLSSGTIGRPIQ